ncbi:MAG: glycogen debranching enzyme family protein [Candidatus Eremiobacteraeota bacterium]|nr:glycogen debranching enzyme family protein [Candidatus Eremiobacteraeota bacterium]
MGTIAGTLTRRYHGLLIAALRPPLERTLLATKVDETATYRGVRTELATNRWRNGYVSPAGFVAIERFALDGTMPVWHYALGDALLEKRIWMEYGKNAVYVRYRLLRGAAPVDLQLRVFANYRNFHGNTHAGEWTMRVTGIESGVRVDAFDGAQPYWLLADRGTATAENVWYRDFFLSIENQRGLDDLDDNLAAARVDVALEPGQETTLLASTESDVAFADALERRHARDGIVIATWQATPHAAADPGWMRHCVLAADQFVVERPTVSDPKAMTVIAGYPWFADWGRDTMISLPGLALMTGRPEIAQEILASFAAHIDGGMLPNCFPETGEAPQYNTVDGALWFVEALARYVRATGDLPALRTFWPALQSIIDGYRGGTRYGIHMDADGLIVASDPGQQLTWMDARVGDWIVTPRMGKPVEIAALWFNACKRMAELADRLKAPAEEYSRLAQTVAAGFARFWNPATDCCYDVLDGPQGNDATLRPNQLFAIALAYPVLDAAHFRAVVDACAAQLLTSNGLRTLSPADPKFIGEYSGPAQHRDASYHQGTAWPWLLGAFSVAHARAYGNAATARSFLEPLADQLFDYGLGSVSEIADGADPFRPRGAVSQAWSVGELLRAWHDIGEICAGRTM